MQNRATSAHQSYQRFHTLLVIGTFCLLIAVVVVTSYLRYRDFLSYHHAMAVSTVGELGHAVERTILERHRLVKLFAEDHAGLIAAVAQDPADFHRQDLLARAIARVFPGFFAFTLTGADGHPLIEDFEGFVGNLCLEDVRHYAQTAVNDVRIHPNGFVYHYDVMARWGSDKGVLLISFPTDEISALLRAAQAPGHELLVVQPDAGHLMEIAGQGARDRILRDDYRLTATELQRLLISMPIANSRWALVDLFQTGFVRDHRRDLLLQMGLLILLFGLLNAGVWILLRRSDARRQRADRLKDEFVSVVSHELRTPLTSIQGSLALLEGDVCGVLPTKARELVTIARNNSDRLRVIVDDLLDIRKIEAGKLELDRRCVDLMDLVRDTVAQNHGVESRYRVRFAIREGLEGVKVAIDPLRIGQVLCNLLSNAAKFSNPGDVVEILVRKGPSGEVEVAVRDRGPGVDPAFRERVFDKFAQADGSDARSKGGTGLGLAIVKALIEAHGGQVGYDSTVGQGSTFFFRLPVTGV